MARAFRVCGYSLGIRTSFGNVTGLGTELSLRMLGCDMDPHILPGQGCPGGPEARMAKGPESG